MKYKCICGNVSEISFNKFKNGRRCMRCRGKEKLTFEYVRQYFKDNDCISEYFLFDLLYSNTFHYLRKAFRVIGDNVEDHILVKGTINKFKKKLLKKMTMKLVWDYHP